VIESPAVTPSPTPEVVKAPVPPVKPDAPKAPETKPVVKAPAEASPSGDWRQSWGKAEPEKEPAPVVSHPAPVTPAVPRTELPVARTDRPDPLSNPEAYSKPSVQDLVGKTPKPAPAAADEAGKPVQVAVNATPPPAPTAAFPGTSLPPPAPTFPGTAAPPPVAVDRAPAVPAAPPVSPMPAATVGMAPGTHTPAPVSPTPVEPPAPPSVTPAPMTPPPAAPAPVMPAPVAHGPEANPPAPEVKPAVPMGMGSVMAATSPELAAPEPPPVAPPAPPAPKGAAPKAPPSRAAQAAVQVNDRGGNAFSGPAMAGPAQGGPEVANAFSSGTPPMVQGGYPAMMPAMAQGGRPMVMPAGPMPPAPGYAQAAMMPVVNPTMMVPPNPNAVQPVGFGQDGASLPQLQAMLRDSLYPSQREWAADRLALHDWRVEPQVLDSLLTAAREDPAPMVRAGCVRSLAKMRANTVPVVAVVQALRGDADPRVREEVDQALATLLGGQTLSIGAPPGKNP
jgi:hypothetical protein